MVFLTELLFFKAHAQQKSPLLVRTTSLISCVGVGFKVVVNTVVSFLVVFITISLSFALFIVLEHTVIHGDDYFQCPAIASASSHGKDERKNWFYCREPKETRGRQQGPPAGERKVKNRTTKEGEVKASRFPNFSPEFNRRNSKWTKGE